MDFNIFEKYAFWTDVYAMNPKNAISDRIFDPIGAHHVLFWGALRLRRPHSGQSLPVFRHSQNFSKLSLAFEGPLRVYIEATTAPKGSLRVHEGPLSGLSGCKRLLQGGEKCHKISKRASRRCKMEVFIVHFTSIWANQRNVYLGKSFSDWINLRRWIKQSDERLSIELRDAWGNTFKIIECK